MTTSRFVDATMRLVTARLAVSGAMSVVLGTVSPSEALLDRLSIAEEKLTQARREYNEAAMEAGEKPLTQ